MSEEGFRGGIGGMDGVLGAREEPSPRPEPAGLTLQHVERLTLGLDVRVAAVAAELDQARAEIEGLRQHIVQIQGENQQIVNACAQYQQAIVDHNNKLNALAAATSRNYRVEAARIAANCRQPGDNVQRMRDLTEMWLGIFEAPTQEPQREEEPFEIPSETPQRMN